MNLSTFSTFCRKMMWLPELCIQAFLLSSIYSLKPTLHGLRVSVVSLLRNTFSSFPVLFPTSNPIFPQHSAQFPSTKKPSNPTPGHSDLLSSEFLYHLYIYTIQSTILLTLFYIILQLLNGYFFFSQPYKFFCILHSD